MSNQKRPEIIELVRRYDSPKESTCLTTKTETIPLSYNEMPAGSSTK